METASLKSFATWARTALIREVSARIAAVLAPASKERVESTTAIANLERDVAAAGGDTAGRDAVADKVAYTWFNRIIALRFMDANGYTGIGVVSPPRGQTTGQPEVLADAKRGNIDPAVVTNKRTIEAISALLDGTRRSDDSQSEAFALLLAEYCRHWNRSMPFMFEREGDYTELLIPANLLADDSVLARASGVLTEDVCQDVEVIGWLYQFYISERKDEVFAGFKKNKKAGAAEIPAATQLFTPHWIVRYLVENSLGRLWMVNHPSSRLVDRMEYYVAPDGEEADFLRVGTPEALKIVDPACGSGHMLTYAFDLLYAIYEEEGYAPVDIPKLILTNNLYGIEIDPRAASLAAFALAMKARAGQRSLFATQIEPNVCVLDPIHFDEDEIALLLRPTEDPDLIGPFWNQFEQADVFGSLIRPAKHMVDSQSATPLPGSASDELLNAQVDQKARRVLRQARFLAENYSVVITNPPYMGSGNMAAQLAEWTKLHFPDEKQDLYGCFMSRCAELATKGGLVAMVVGDTWLTIKSFEGLRRRLLADTSLRTVVHLRDISNHPDIFGANVAFSFSNIPDDGVPTPYIFLDELRSEAKADSLGKAIRNPDNDNVFTVTSSQFREIPGEPIVYRLSERLRGIFRHPELGASLAVKKGLDTGKNATHLRLWHEVSRRDLELESVDRATAQSSTKRWYPLNKGGDRRRWYGNQSYVIDWLGDGMVLRDRARTAGIGAPTIRNADFYYRESLGWTMVSSSEFSIRYYPPGFVFGSGGGGIFANEQSKLLCVLGLLNSVIMSRAVTATAPTLNFDAGPVSRFPLAPSLVQPKHEEVVRRLVEIHRRDWNRAETAWDFAGPEILEGTYSGPIAERVRSLRDAWNSTALEVVELELRNNAHMIELYELEGELDPTPDASSLTLSFLRSTTTREDAGHFSVSSERQVVEDLVSYAVGCMLGRYSLDKPGLVLADQGADIGEYLTRVPDPSFVPDADNVIPIVDGDWFEDDIVERFRQFLRIAFGEEHLEENVRFVAVSLGVKDIRDYFVQTFFKDHVQRYKKRPIYWLFSSPKGSFSALIYLHRYTTSTVSTVLNEYLREFKAKLEASRQQHERVALGTGSPREKAAAEREVDRLRKVLLELDEYEHDVLYPLATQQLAIDLNDGVKTNYSKFGDALRRIPGLEVSDE